MSILGLQLPLNSYPRDRRYRPSPPSPSHEAAQNSFQANVSSKDMSLVIGGG